MVTGHAADAASKETMYKRPHEVQIAAGLHRALLLGFVALDLLNVQFHETVCTWQASSTGERLLGKSLIKRQEVALLLQMGLSSTEDRDNGVLCGHFSPVSELVRHLCLIQSLFEELGEDHSQLQSRDVARAHSFPRVLGSQCGPHLHRDDVAPVGWWLWWGHLQGDSG